MKKTYSVLRQHQGDVFYSIGDERTADENDVKHLVNSGVLELKAEKPVKNKAAKPVKNKSK